MSQIEIALRRYLARHPEIEDCVCNGLINRRSLARLLIKEGIAKGSQMEAIIATLRRYEFTPYDRNTKEMFKETTVHVKDQITVLVFEKNKKLVQSLPELIENTQYEAGETLKLLLGTRSVTLILDEGNTLGKTFRKKFSLKLDHKHISELSIVFNKKIIDTKGVISYISRLLYLHDILITELITSGDELLFYVRDEYVLKAYELIKGLKK